MLNPSLRSDLPVALQVRFYIWKLRWIIAALACSFALTLTGKHTVQPLAANEVHAAVDIATGQVIKPADLNLQENGIPNDTAGTEEHPFAGDTALVDIPQGTPIVSAMVAPTLSTAFAKDGKLITSVNIANPEVLVLTHSGSRISLIAYTEDGTEVLVPQAVVISPHETLSTRADSGKSFLGGSNSGKNDMQSSTVLVAVLPKEAERLAQTLSWDSTLMAAIVS